MQRLPYACSRRIERKSDPFVPRGVGHLYQQQGQGGRACFKSVKRDSATIILPADDDDSAETTVWPHLSDASHKLPPTIPLPRRVLPPKVCAPPASALEAIVDADGVLGVACSHWVGEEKDPACMSTMGIGRVGESFIVTTLWRMTALTV